MKRSIVVVEAGWVFLADSINEVSTFKSLPVLQLTGASVIRVWGTTAGLGEIALKGPTKDTVLDFAGTVDVPVGHVLAIIPCTY
jgi:hypothetical protein